jgi:hypothetical protein
MITIIIIIVISIFVFKYVMDHIINKILFIPKTCEIDSDVLNTYEYNHIKIRTSDNILLSTIYKQVSNKWILYFHGNGMYLGTSVEHIDQMLPKQYSKFIIDYRSYGASDCVTINTKNIMIDAKTAWLYLTNEMEILPENIIIVGYSLGGAVATKLIHDYKITPSRLILINSFSSIYDMIIQYVNYIIADVISLIYEFPFNTIEYLKYINIPITIMHCIHDRLISYNQALQNYNVIKNKKNVSFVKLIGDHCNFDANVVSTNIN